VERFFNGIHLPEPLDGEVRLEREKLVDEELRFLAPTEMTERGDQWLVAVNETRISRHRGTTCKNRPLIIALEGIGDRIMMLEVGKIRLGRRQLAIALEPLQRSLGLADVAIGQGTQPPTKRRTGIKQKRPVEKCERPVEITSYSR